MQSLTDESQIAEWRQYMQDYSSRKRPQAVGNSEVPHVHTHKEKKTKEYAFDTVLAQYRDPRKETEAKQRESLPEEFKRKAVKEFLDSKAQGFDIITLEERKADLRAYEERLKKKRILPKAQVTYNIVTNGDHPEHHWKGTQRPEPKREYTKNINMDIFRDFNIISNKYWEGHDPKHAADEEVKKKELDEKYKKTHDFNHVTCSYYDKLKQDDYLREKERLQKEHGKDYLNRLPPTLKARETIVFDASKEVPEEVKAFDLKKKNQKRRYEKRYDLEEEYRDLDIQLQDRTEQMAVNRYKGQKFYEDKQKGYDNITLNPTKDQIKKLDNYAHVKPNLSLWDQIQQEAEERVPEPLRSKFEQNTECQVNKVVEIDSIPLYRRSVDATREPPAQSEHQNNQEKLDYSGPPANDQPNFESLQPSLTTYEYQPVFESMPPNPTSRDMNKLYNPELDKHANLYRQPEGDNQSNQKPPSIANNGNNMYSRMNSGVSNRSRLSFASEGIKSRLSSSSNKLPAISKQEMINPYNPPSAKSGSKRSMASSSIKKSNLVESGAFY